MPEKRKQRISVNKEQSAEAALDSLNMELGAKGDSPISRRRVMEGSIEAEARKRRGREGPASSTLKPQGS